MNNDELKKKIVEVLKKAMEPIEYGGDSEHAPEVHYPTEEEIADDLIAAGIGDVKEAEKEYRDAIFLAVTSQTMTSERSRYIELNKNIAEHRAKVAERALRDELVQKAIRLGVTDIRPWYIQALNEAEKKIAAEEQKND